MKRTAILIDERDRRLGRTDIPDAIHIIQHGETMFIRSSEAVRLAGGGVGVIFRVAEVFVRNKLEPV